MCISLCNWLRPLPARSIHWASVFATNMRKIGNWQNSAFETLNHPYNHKQPSIALRNRAYNIHQGIVMNAEKDFDSILAFHRKISPATPHQYFDPKRAVA